MVNQIKRVKVVTWEMCSTLKKVLKITAAAWQKITGRRHRSTISHGTSCWLAGSPAALEGLLPRRVLDALLPDRPPGIEGLLREGRRLNGPLMLLNYRTNNFDLWYYWYKSGKTCMTEVRIFCSSRQKTVFLETRK